MNPLASGDRSVFASQEDRARSVFYEKGEAMKLPGKIKVAFNVNFGNRLEKDNLPSYGRYPGDVTATYVPASEVEALRERVKQLELALLKVTSQAERLTRPQTEHWRLAILGSIIDIAREALGGGEEKN